VPDPPVVSDLLDRWSEQRKKARVMLVLDVSGSMGDPADPDDDSGPTKLDLAKQAAIDSLDQFSPDDLVALRVFSTNLGDKEDENFLDLQPYGRAGDQAEKMKGSIRDLVPTNATPLYDVIDQSFDDAETGYDPDRINAIVVLTDGQNDDGDRDDDDKQLNQLLASLRSSTEGETAQPVRVFTIGYGRDADIDTLRRISEASNAAVYDASNAATISNVLTNVISNF
jgi:Ca-activated chloride channel family protein